VVADSALLSGMFAFTFLWAYALAPGTHLSALAHPLSESHVLADVRADAVVARFDIKVEDLTLFHTVTTNADKHIPGSDLQRAAEAHVPFLRRYFTILNPAGETLAATLLNTTTNSIPPEGVHTLDLPTTTLSFEFRFPLAEKPDYLTFHQEYGGADSAVPSMVDLLVLNAGRNTGGSVKLPPGIPRTVSFRGSESDRGLMGLAAIRARKAAHERATLGITDHEETHAFLQIEQHYALLELIVPLYVIESWDSSMRGTNDIFNTADETRASFSPRLLRIGELLRQNTRVDMDTRRRQVVNVDQVFHTPSTRDFAEIPDHQNMHRLQARLAIAIQFDGWERSTNVSFTWNLYGKELPFLKIQVRDYQGGFSEQFLTPSHSNLVWTANAKAPGTVGPPMPPPLQTVRVSALSFAGLMIMSLWLIAWICRLKPERRIAILIVVFIVAGSPFVRVIEWTAPFMQTPISVDDATRIAKGLLLADKTGAPEIEIYDAKLVAVPRRTDPRDFNLWFKWRAVNSICHWGHKHSITTAHTSQMLIQPRKEQWLSARHESLSWDQLGDEVSVEKVPESLIRR
jgi:hypothetical protein